MATRFPDPALEQRAAALTWGVGVTQGALLVLGLVALLPPASLGPAMGAVALGMVIVVIATIVVVVMYLFMLGRFATQLRQQAKMAQEIWSSAAPNAPPASAAN